MKKKLMLTALLIGIMSIGTVYGAFLTYKGFVEIYGTKYPLGVIELETHGLKPIEGLEAGMQHVGEILIWTYSPNAELVLQLMQVAQVVTNFRSFTVKICMPLDVIFVVDVTGSMDDYIDDVKAKLKELMGVLTSQMREKCPVQFGVVGFKDYEVQTTSCPLTDDYEAVKTFIDGLTAWTGAGIPQSHYLGFEKARELFHDVPDWYLHEKIVVFVSDAQAGYNDLPEWDRARDAAWALANDGVKIHSVLCGPLEEPELSQLNYYSAISEGHFIPGAMRIVPGVTRDPTWIVKLTPITPFDSMRFKLPNSGEKADMEVCELGKPYRLRIYVDYFCKAVPWHEDFIVELGAWLEHAELPPYEPPPPVIKVVPPIRIELGTDPIDVAIGDSITFDWVIPEIAAFIPINVTLYWQAPGEPVPGTEIYFGDTFPDDYIGSVTKTAMGPVGTWYVWLFYTFDWEDPIYTTGAFAMFTVHD